MTDLVTAQDRPSIKWLTGRLAEYEELLDVLGSRPGITVISADPLSGTTGILNEAADPLSHLVLVDARCASDALDLAMAIADRVIAAVVPEASAWWSGAASGRNTETIRLWRSMGTMGIDLEELRIGSGVPLMRLRDALALAAAVSDPKPLVVLDHLGAFLAAVGADEARSILGELRSAKQAHEGLDLVLVEHASGVISSALRDRSHPLFHSGHLLRFRRPEPHRFGSDLVITRASTDVPVDLLVAAAELAEGVPSLTWRITELTPTDLHGDAETRAFAGWRLLRRHAEPTYARLWETIRRVHRSALDVISALSLGLGPYEIPAASKTVNDCLRRLRETGTVWQPQARTWAIADPLLTWWASEHAPSWAVRRASTRLT